MISFVIVLALFLAAGPINCSPKTKLRVRSHGRRNVSYRPVAE